MRGLEGDGSGKQLSKEFHDEIVRHVTGFVIDQQQNCKPGEAHRVGFDIDDQTLEMHSFRLEDGQRFYGLFLEAVNEPVNDPGRHLPQKRPDQDI